MSKSTYRDALFVPNENHGQSDSKRVASLDQKLHSLTDQDFTPRDLNEIDKDIDSKVWNVEVYMNMASDPNDWDNLTPGLKAINAYALQQAFRYTMKLNNLVSIRQDVQLHLARDAFIGLFINAKPCRKVQSERSKVQPKRRKVQPQTFMTVIENITEVQPQTSKTVSEPITNVQPQTFMTVSEFIMHAKPSLLRHIMYMACDRDDSGTLLSHIAQREWLKDFEPQQ